MDDDLDIVFKALADPTRRRLLDALRDGRQSTGDLVKLFPELTRFGVMKHLGVLEEAGLLLVAREGRVRWNTLNPMPIRLIYERWIGKYAEFWSGELAALKRSAEGTDQ